jgi:CDP-glucose 4,6-dehydratase
MKNNNKILITGHSGFIGSWLYYYLKKKNYDVYGISLKSKNKLDLFYKLGINLEKKSTILNILNYELLKKYIKKIRPNIIIHLAAESLVLKSMDNPILTYNTNINGTLNILELINKYRFIETCIFFTTDKVYHNSDNKKKFKETDVLNGDDPYSGSKAASEIVINSYAKSFLKNKKIVVLRSGNIIGGGDNSLNRIVPDIIRSIKSKKTLIIRNPNSTRPWQYITDTIDIIYKILEKINKKKFFFKIYNIAPNSKNMTVNQLITIFKQFFDFKIKYIKHFNKEKKFLELNSYKIKKELGIKNKFTSKQSIIKVAKFYYDLIVKKENIQELIKREIKDHDTNSKNL